uniref:Uncharacterized protein n=1 Tax=Otus sunia TaxID=257818 RepID=A0A8C8A885_9STRI
MAVTGMAERWQPGKDPLHPVTLEEARVGAGPEGDPSRCCPCSPLTRVEGERDLAVILRLHAILHSLVVLCLPSLSVGLFRPLVVKVHVLHLVSQVICRGRRSGRGPPLAGLGPSRAGGCEHGGTSGSRGDGAAGGMRDPEAGAARRPEAEEPQRNGARRGERPHARGKTGRDPRPSLALGRGRSGPGAPARGRSPRRPCLVRGAGRPVSPGPGGPSSTTSMISSSPWKPSAPGPSAGSMPACPRAPVVVSRAQGGQRRPPAARARWTAAPSMQRGGRTPARPTMAAALGGLRGLLAAAGLARPRGRPARPGTRFLGQSCRRPAGPRAGPEPGSGGLPEGVEYIPTRKKGKNPMKPVGVAWAIGLPSGIILFLLAKREVDKNRLEQLKIRRKMMEANQGEYKTERYERVFKGA